MGNDTAKTITRAKTIVNAASAVSLTSVYNEHFNILLLKCFRLSSHRMYKIAQKVIHYHELSFSRIKHRQ